MVNESVVSPLQDDLFQDIEIADSPIKYCTVTLSDVIAKGRRLEASVFDVEAKRIRERVENCMYRAVALGGSKGLIKHAYYPGRFKRVYCEKGNGIPFYLPSQITDIYPEPDKFISALTHCDMKELKLKSKTLLLTRSGTVGTVSLVSETIEGNVFSDDVIRISFKNDIDLGYVYVYLKSDVGNMMLTTNRYGSVITHIEPEHLKAIPIPDAPARIKKRINDLIVHSYKLRDESNVLIDEATALLKKALRFPAIEDFEVSFYRKNAGVDTFNVKLSNMAGRVDASYHVPVIDAIVNHMKKNAKEVTIVGDKRISKHVILPPRFARVYVEKGYGRVLLGGKQLFELDPSGKKYLSRTKHAKLMNRLEVAENTILITRSGTIGKVVLVPRHWEHWIPSDHIIRVVPANREIAGYLSIFLSSVYGRTLIMRFTYGSVVDEIDDVHVGSIPFPLLKDIDTQQRINELALEANEKRYEAYKLEQQALQIMDSEVIFAK